MRIGPSGSFRKKIALALPLNNPIYRALLFPLRPCPPAGDAPEYRSGQFMSWERIEPTPPIQNIERVSGKRATAYSYQNNALTDFLRFSGIAGERH